MGTIRWIFGGLIGAAVGVLIWVLVGYFTQYEIRWIAWGIGFLVGFGVRYAAYLNDDEASLGKGVVAAAIAIAAIITAKFIVFMLLVGGSGGDAGHDWASEIPPEDADAIAERTKDLKLPPGLADVDWAEAEKHQPGLPQQDHPSRTQLSPEDQRKFEEQLAQLLAEKPTFADFFSPWDLLWFGLAVFTAFKIGVGTYGDD